MSKYWTLLSLKEYFEEKLKAMDNAVNKAEAAHERRLENMNEFRSQLKDQQQTFVERNYFEVQHTKLEEKIKELKTYMDKLEGRKEGGSIIWAYVVAVISLLAAFLSITITLIK
jgi:hypothetical protein